MNSNPEKKGKDLVLCLPPPENIVLEVLCCIKFCAITAKKV